MGHDTTPNHPPASLIHHVQKIETNWLSKSHTWTKFLVMHRLIEAFDCYP
jgi:hypothetical protein